MELWQWILIGLLVLCSNTLLFFILSKKIENEGPTVDFKARGIASDNSKAIDQLEQEMNNIQLTLENYELKQKK